MEKTAYDVLGETRKNVEEILAKMLFIKKEGRSRAELRELVTQVSVAFLTLRQINRIILQDEDNMKQETEAAKMPVDYTTLQLNNLLYQKHHYLKAINACKDFKSKYPDINLVPEEEFFKDAPEEFKKDPSLKDDPHKTMLERLNFELYQRKELCKQRDLLEARKKMLQESITNRKKFLASLPSHLKALKKASLPVQQQLGILHTKRMKQHHLAELLPAPLYILYSQILAVKEAFDEDIDLEVTGNAKEAQSLARQHAMKDSGPLNPDDGRVDDEPPEEDDDLRRRKRVKKSHQKEVVDDGVYHTHPLSVLWHIFAEERGSIKRPSKLLTLRFEYLTKLNIICAGVEGIYDGPLDLLTNLFPDDTGLNLPTQVAKLSAGLDFEYELKRVMHPYKWAQHLGGLDFLSECPPSLTDASSPVEQLKRTVVTKGLAAYHQQYRIQTVLDKLRNRRNDHSSLKEQLDCLSDLKLPPLKFTTVPWSYYNAKCYLHSWLECTPPSGIPKFHAHLQLDESTLSPRVMMESTREDGELPSFGLGTVASRYLDKAPTFKDRKHKDCRFSPVASEDVFLAARELGPEELDERDVVDEDILSGVVVNNSEYALNNVTPDAGVVTPWEDYGARVFTITLKRDDDMGGKSAVLDAQVKITSEYPIRPPHFTLTMSSNGLVPILPAAPSGVLDVIEAPRTSSANAQSFNELRAIEIEVNMHVMETIPQWEENRILAHQMHLLAMMFDSYVDHQLSGKHFSRVNDTGKSGNIGFEAAPRLMRGRDRQMSLF